MDKKQAEALLGSSEETQKAEIVIVNGTVVKSRIMTANMTTIIFTDRIVYRWKEKDGTIMNKEIRFLTN